MKFSDSIAKLAPALVAAQGELKGIGKDATNPAFKSKYATLDHIIDAVRPVLAKHALALVQGASTPVTDETGTLCGFTVETMLIHASGEYVMNAAVMPLVKRDPQGAGGALTYGRRYGLSALLSISTDEDDDGNTASRPNATAAASRSNKSSAPSTSNTSSHASKPLPFGDKKGTPLGELTVDELEKLVKWCRATPEKAEKWAGLAESIGVVLADQALGV
jgi:hypothetical protein